MDERDEATADRLRRQTAMIGRLVRQLEGARHLVLELRRRVVTQDCEIQALRATVAELMIGRLVRQLEGARHLLLELRRRVVTQDCEIQALRASGPTRG